MGAILAGGIIVGLLIAAVIMKVANKDGKMKTEYDERQKIVRGKSYMLSFYGVVITNAIFMMLQLSDVDLSVLGMEVFFIPIFVGILIHVSYSIFNDGYFGMNNNTSKYMIFMAFIAVINIACGIMPWADEGLIQDGKIYPNFANLLMGILFLVIAIEMIIKKAMDKGE
ncbi:MAG: hypothetical protein K5639_00805 [Eubacterium sp.]|nr:hypothetical protein [Eubacterium sp.]